MRKSTETSRRRIRPINRSKFMQLALQAGHQGCARGKGGPFGACIVRKGKVLAVGYNSVLQSRIPTRHAEINVIDSASRHLKTYKLNGCEIYSTTEPCVMCFAAIHWAGIRAVYFGTAVSDVKKLGFNELTISNKILKRLGHSTVRIHSGFCRKECLELLNFWKRLPRRRTY